MMCCQSARKRCTVKLTLSSIPSDAKTHPHTHACTRTAQAPVRAPAHQAQEVCAVRLPGVCLRARLVVVVVRTAPCPAFLVSAAPGPAYLGGWLPPPHTHPAGQPQRDGICGSSSEIQVYPAHTAAVKHTQRHSSSASRTSRASMPSISVSNWLTRRSAGALLPSPLTPAPPPRRGASASISSKKSTQGCAARARANSCRTARSDSPTYLFNSSGPCHTQR